MKFIKKILLSFAISASVAPLVVPSAQAKSDAITIMAWGTTWQSGLQEASRAFTDKTGIKVNLITQATSGEGLVKLQTMRDKPEVDVWFTTASVAERATSDDALFAPLPAEKIPNLEQLAAGTATSHYVGVYGYPMSIIYRTDLVSDPLTSWQDLWADGLERKIGLPTMGIYQGRALMIASMAFGGTQNDVDKGFEMLQQLKPNVAMYYGSDAQARTAIAQGEISVLVAPPSQGKRVADAGHPVKVISPNPAIMNFDVMTIVKSGKEELAAQYINFLLERDTNEKFAASVNMAPVHKDAKPSDVLAPQLPKEDDKVILDEKFVNENIGEWSERFNNEIAS